MTDRATPSPHIVLELLDDAGVLQDPALVRGLQDIGALGAGPAPQASAELARLMADGGKPQQGRRTKNRITFIGGALAVSMGVGISGVAAGTLHLTDGLGAAVDSASRFRAADAADSSGAERSEASSVVAPAAVTPPAPPIAPVPSPSAVPAPPGGAEEAAAAPAAGSAHAAPPASGPQPGQVTSAAPQSATTPGPVEAPAPAAPAVGAPPTPVEGPGTVPGSPVARASARASQKR
ncbi:hypothetical protein GM708_06100 [Vibrio cholerae]|nr:hypothetical protein [Vibrio cholerae]